MLTIGVEEEFFVFDPVDTSLALDGLPGLQRLQEGYDGVAGFDHEFQLAIVESRTEICANLASIRASLSGLRASLQASAAADGLAFLSAGTMPTANWRTVPVTPKPRYDEINEHYRDVVRQRLTCGCHVHVGVPDRDLAARVVSRVQVWLPFLLALSASSPFREGLDTGYASSRSLLWGGFPVAGPPGPFASYADYVARVDALIESGAILDAGHVYWDVRLGIRYETVEFRIADACTTVDEVVLQVALCRALVATCLREAVEAEDQRPTFSQLYRASSWRAARSGLEGNLIDVVTGRQSPAWQSIKAMLGYLRPALEAADDWDEVMLLIAKLRRHGNSSQRQLRAMAESGRIEHVIEQLAEESARGAIADVSTG